MSTIEPNASDLQVAINALEDKDAILNELNGKIAQLLGREELEGEINTTTRSVTP